MSAPLDYGEALLSRAPVIVRRRVLWGECDPAGVVYTPRFCDYAVSAREWFMREGVGVDDRPHPSRPGIAYPMRAMGFEFAGYLEAGDLFDMTVTVAEISRRTFTTQIVASKVGAGKSFVTRLTSVCVEQAGGVSTGLPEDVRAKLEAYRNAHP